MVQETFLLALRYLGGFKFKSSLYTWMARICVHLCYKQIRKRERLLVSMQEDLEKLTLPIAEKDQRDRESKEENQLRMVMLGRLSLSLSEKCRAVMRLRDLEGESYAQIAKSLKMPIGTVMSQLGRCRKALKGLVENELKGN